MGNCISHLWENWLITGQVDALCGDGNFPYFFESIPTYINLGQANLSPMLETELNVITHMKASALEVFPDLLSSLLFSWWAILGLGMQWTNRKNMMMTGKGRRRKGWRPLSSTMAFDIPNYSWSNHRSLSGSREKPLCLLVSVCSSSLRSREALGHLFGSFSVLRMPDRAGSLKWDCYWSSSWRPIDLWTGIFSESTFLTPAPSSAGQQAKVQC